MTETQRVNSTVSATSGAAALAESGPDSRFRPRPRIAAFVLALAALLTLAIPVAAPTLNGVSLLGLPLGFYFAAQGGLLLVGLLALWLSGPWNHSSRLQRLEAFRASLSACGGWLTAGLASTLTGALFVMGHDGLPLFLGLAAGLIVSLVFFAPALDRAGALHLDDLLGRLTGSHYAAAAAGLCMAAALVMLMSIELEVATLAISAVAVDLDASIGTSETVLIGAASLAVIVSLIPGRTFWYGYKALALVILAAGIWALAWVATGREPLGLIPQIAYAPGISSVTAAERALLMEGLADPVSMPPFVRPFVQVSHLNFFVLTLSMLLGTAVLPHTLWRRKEAAKAPGAHAAKLHTAANAPASGSYASRQKTAFSLVAAVIVLTAIPALSIFAKTDLFQKLAAGIEVTAQPKWLQSAQIAGFMRVCSGAETAATPGVSVDQGDVANAGANEASSSPGSPAASASDCGDPTGRLRVQDLAINAAAVPLIMPQLAGMNPQAALAVATTLGFLALLSLAATLRMGVEAVTGFSRPLNAAPSETSQPPPHLALHLLIAAALAAASSGIVYGLAESPINRLYWAFAVLGASLFPMVLLSALWPRISGPALALGGLAGLSGCLYYVIGTTSIFSPQFALTWSAISDAPPWLLDELREYLATCAKPGPDSLEACRAALEQGRELANWFGIDPRAAAAIGAPLGIVTAFVAGILSPSFWRRNAGPKRT